MLAKPDTGQVLIHVHVPQDLKADYQKVADQMGLSMAALTRLAMREIIAGYRPKRLFGAS